MDIFDSRGGSRCQGRVLTPEGQAATGWVAFVVVPKAVAHPAPRSASSDRGPVEGGQGRQGGDFRPRKKVSGRRTLPPAPLWWLGFAPLACRHVGRSQFRLVPYLRAAPTDEGSGAFELGPIASTDEPAYLFIHHPHYVNHIERLSDFHFERSTTITLRRGTEVAGRLTTPAGVGIAGALLHFGELWTNGCEGVVGRTRTGADGTFRFVGLPRTIAETLRGETHEQRQAFFVAAFSPDVLLEANETLVEESPIWNAFAVTPGDTSLRLIGATQGHGASVNLRLRDTVGKPVRTWAEALILDADGIVHRGSVARQTSTAQLFHRSHPRGRSP